MSVVLALSPHPDDELLGAGATLMALRDAGWRVVNLACSLGREPDRERRRAELMQACARAGFELLVPEGLAPIGRDDDPVAAVVSLSAAVQAAFTALRPELLVGPWVHDAHHGHQLVGRALRAAVVASGRPRRVFSWALWWELEHPNLLVPFGEPRLRELEHALQAHGSQLERNGFDRALAARATLAAVLGVERVFGHGISGIEHPYAELLCDERYEPGEGWSSAPPRVLDPARPVG